MAGVKDSTSLIGTDTLTYQVVFVGLDVGYKCKNAFLIDVSVSDGILSHLLEQRRGIGQGWADLDRNLNGG